MALMIPDMGGTSKMALMIPDMIGWYKQDGINDTRYDWVVQQDSF